MSVNAISKPTPALINCAICNNELPNGVRGGKVYGEWPGLKNDQLYEGRDLALTTDFRDVFGEVARKHLGTPNVQQVFPGYAASETKFKGFIG